MPVSGQLAVGSLRAAPGSRRYRLDRSATSFSFSLRHLSGLPEYAT
jgi:hypothetical protein